MPTTGILHDQHRRGGQGAVIDLKGTMEKMKYIDWVERVLQGLVAAVAAV